MSPFTPTLADRALEERRRGAWATYALTTAGLEGREYEEAEAAAWDALQRELDRLAEDPTALPRPGRL